MSHSLLLFLCYIINLIFINITHAQNKIIAHIGDNVITTKDIQSRMQALLLLQRLSTKQNVEVSPEIQQAAMQSLLQEKILFAHIGKQNIPTGERVHEMISEWEKNNKIKAGSSFRALLQHGIDSNSFINYFRGKLTQQMLMGQFYRNYQPTYKELLHYVNITKNDAMQIEYLKCKVSDDEQNIIYHIDEKCTDIAEQDKNIIINFSNSNAISVFDDDNNMESVLAVRCTILDSKKYDQILHKLSVMNAQKQFNFFITSVQNNQYIKMNHTTI